MTDAEIIAIARKGCDSIYCIGERLEKHGLTFKDYEDALSRQIELDLKKSA